MKNLNGVWRLWAFPAQPDKKDIGEIVSGPAMPADVPGNVEFSLQAAGLLPDDIFMGNNILKCQDFETWDYLYERHFTMTPEELEKPWRLVFEGVNCIADYYLNGVLLAHTENALIAHTIPCGAALAGENTLQVYLRSPMAAASEEMYYPSVDGKYHAVEQERLRMPAHSFGWDIMPRVLSAGLWRGVRIEEIPETELLDPYIATRSVGEDSAELMLNFRVRTAPKNLRSMSIRVEGACGDARFFAEEKLWFSAGFVRIHVDSPKLWMPRGYGEANLYDTTVTLLVNGEPADTWHTRVGIRTLTLERGMMPDGMRNFQFEVNGVPVFLKGSNWVPMDAFHSRDPLRYAKAFEMLSDLNCNVVRCWGGNVYEDHAFFDFCDELGILVWQDFSMACSHYPEDEKFMGIIGAEARQIIRKLRVHPSLALWCGDNECDYYADDPHKIRITRELLPRIAEQEDPFRPYLASSPDLGERQPGDTRVTGFSAEQHIWGARDHYRAKFYTDHNARFVSETGYHGCNSVESIKKFITPEKLWPWQDNDEWGTHSADCGKGWYTGRIPMMAKQTRQMFGAIPDNLEDFAFASQFTQAEAKKYFIEKMRMGRPGRTGVIWWNLLDGWPQFSDAIVDYYFDKKLAYSRIRLSQQDTVLCMGDVENWKAPLIVCNDTLRPVQGEYRVWDADTGETLAGGSFRADANTSKKLAGVDIFYSDKRLLILELTIGGKTVRNYRLTGEVPYDLARAREWDRVIGSLNA